VIIREKIQTLTGQFDRLSISERNFIGEELMEVFSKTMRMIWNLSRNLEEVTLEKPAARFLFPEVR
jgi:fructose-1,6-bisphosphatase